MHCGQSGYFLKNLVFSCAENTVSVGIRMGKYELFSCGLGEMSLTGSCEEFHEFFGFHKKGEIF